MFLFILQKIKAILQIFTPSRVYRWFRALERRFGVFQKLASRLLPDEWVELEISGCRHYFRAFRLEVDIRGMNNFEIGSRAKLDDFWKIDKITLFSIIWWSHLVSNSDRLPITGYNFEVTVFSFLKLWAPRRFRIILKT